MNEADNKNWQDGQQKFEELVKKIESLKKAGTIDLSTEEDLSIAVMNLISLEEHFYFTGAKTGREEYFDFLSEIREQRKALLGKLINQHEGETWCVSKHLLATAMRLIEVGTKLYKDGKKDEAKDIFQRGHKIYSLFWAVRLKLVDVAGLKNMAGADLAANKAGKAWTLEQIMDKLVDCCDE